MGLHEEEQTSEREKKTVGPPAGIPDPKPVREGEREEGVEVLARPSTIEEMGPAHCLDL